MPGDLDTNFDTDGIVITDVTGNTEPDIGRAVALQPDGKILVAGRTNLNFSLVRYEADGSLDAGFGNNGSAVTSINNGDTAYALVVQPDGKIIVAGTSINQFAMVRYNTDGSLDTSFDGDGIVTTPVAVGTSAIAYAIALQADGKIVLGGYLDVNPDLVVADLDFALMRYNTDGSLDTFFDNDGKVTTPIGAVGSGDVINAVAVQPDGKIVAAGITQNQEFVVARYNSDGSLDNSFGANGIAITDISGPDFVYAVALQPDGKILVAGQSATQMGPLGFAVARYDSNGSLDTTFSGDGKVVIPLPGLSIPEANALAVLPDGKIMVGGQGLNDEPMPDNDFSLVRLNANGALDNTFGSNGISTTEIIGQWDNAYGLAVQPDGNIVLAGWRQTTNDFVVLRFEGSPLDVTPDPFNFMDETNVVQDELQTSNLITVSGLAGGVTVPVSVTGGEYALNGSTSYTSSINWVENNDQVNVRHTSALNPNTTVNTILLVGGVMAPNSITHLGTGETVEDTFSTTTPEFKLLSPADGATDLETRVTFTWKIPPYPSGGVLSFRIFVCEDQGFVGCAPTVVAMTKRVIDFAGVEGLLPLALFGTIFGGIGLRKRKWFRVGIIFSIYLLGVIGIVASGGGGGSSGGGTTPTDEKSYTATGLNPGTTYYWKVSVSDGIDTVESETRSFTTM